MSVREITLWPNRDLITVAQPAALDKISADALDDLADTMLSAHGLGLESTQVRSTWRDGFPTALIVVVEDMRPGHSSTSIPRSALRVWQIANPKIVHTSPQRLMRREGCLSIPDYYENVERPWEVHVEADVLHDNGTWESRRGEGLIKAEGIFGHALQHEIDHLAGAFFIEEHGSPLKINQARRYAAKRWQKRGVSVWKPGAPQERST